MKKKLGGFLAAAMISPLAVLTLSQQPASALCTVSAFEFVDHTEAYESGCGKVQARIARYFSGTIHYYDGPQAESSSVVYNSTGTWSGGYFRWQQVSGGSWQNWQAI